MIQANFSRVIVTLLLFQVIGARASDFDFASPSVDAVNHAAQDSKSETQKVLGFDPVLEVNPNRGHFSTSIPIELPPNLAGLPSISLQYNSNQGENWGMGVGWQWSLPIIIRNHKLTARNSCAPSKP